MLGNGADGRAALIDGDDTVQMDTAWPTENTLISSPFGPRLKFSENERYDFHPGIDIPGERGDAIYAIDDGVVIKAYYEGESESYAEGGTTVLLKHVADMPISFHGKDYTTYYSAYKHLDKLHVQEGDEVKKGDEIATMGDSGSTEFVHLHFETMVESYCSAAYQLKHPKSSCNAGLPRGTDPHINPLRVIYYPLNNSITAQVVSTDPLVVRVISTGLDFNAISVKDGDSVYAVDYNERKGINPEIDDPEYDGVTIMPSKFVSGSKLYHVDFKFDADSYEYIDLTDVWGRGIRIRK